jgi:hypothetical protein
VVDPARIIEELNRAGVDYVVIGGVAATLHGCPEQTYDLDILYAATPENRSRLLNALQAMEAEWERPLTDEILQSQPVFALNTKHGDLDIFTSVPGLADYEEAAREAILLRMEGVSLKMLNLATLIATKDAAADPNPRKQSALAFLKELQNCQKRS